MDAHNLNTPFLATSAAAATLVVAMCAYFWFFTSSNSCKPVLDKSEWREFPLVKKEQISHNTALYRFGLPDKNVSLDLPIGQHISVRAKIDDKDVMRSYTPTSLSTDIGFFDLVIKTYPNGLLSSHFGKLKIGDNIEVRGPKGNFQYKRNICRALGMIAGGTGITPMLQIVRAISMDPLDKTKLSLIFANVNEDDILLRSEIDDLVSKNQNLSVHYVLNNPPAGWKGGVGFVTKDMVEKYCPAPAADVKILLCGPPPMIKAMQQHCEELGYEKARALSKMEDQIFKF